MTRHERDIEALLFVFAGLGIFAAIVLLLEVP